MSEIILYQTPDMMTELEVKFDGDTVWLTQNQIALLFKGSRTNIVEHIQNIYKTAELDEVSTCRKFRQVRKEGKRTVERQIDHYNLDVIISVGYRVNSKRGTQFRQWATQRLKDYLVEGYAINEKRLAEKQQQVEYLKTGIRILSRTITQQATTSDSEALKIFAKGLELLDDYDHEHLDTRGKTIRETVYPEVDEYLDLITAMKSDFASAVFASLKDRGFESSVNQIQQSFDGKELYEAIEEKAATLLYLVVKNHSFVDGNKRIGAACFLYFLEKNGMLFSKDNNPLLSNEGLAALTLFVASSKPDEMETVKQLIVSILNRNK
jgi:death-on-curing family protein